MALGANLSVMLVTRWLGVEFEDVMHRPEKVKDSGKVMTLSAKVNGPSLCLADINY